MFHAEQYLAVEMGSVGVAFQVKHSRLLLDRIRRTGLFHVEHCPLKSSPHSNRIQLGCTAN